MPKWMWVILVGSVFPFLSIYRNWVFAAMLTWFLLPIESLVSATLTRGVTEQLEQWHRHHGCCEETPSFSMGTVSAQRLQSETFAVNCRHQVHHSLKVTATFTLHYDDFHCPWESRITHTADTPQLLLNKGFICTFFTHLFIHFP